MTQHRDPNDALFDPRIADWLESDPADAPAQVLQTVLAAFPQVSQRRAWRAAWRFSPMFVPIRIAAAALIVVAAVAVGIGLLGRPSNNVAAPHPSASGSLGGSQRALRGYRSGWLCRYPSECRQ